MSEFLNELRGWQAILKDDKHNIAKLLHPLVRFPAYFRVSFRVDCLKLWIRRSRASDLRLGMETLIFSCGNYQLASMHFIMRRWKRNSCILPVLSFETGEAKVRLGSVGLFVTVDCICYYFLSSMISV